MRLIGRGGMGAVYEVEHLHTGQRLALKVLLAHFAKTGEAAERFKREARASSRIQSDHVVRITDADVAPELDGAPFLVMELLEGSDLERATRGKPTAPADVVEWLRQVARALQKAHDLGIVHRDLKPENLFLTKRDDGTPCVKILDFGIAKITEDGALNTQSGQILGTPSFMAPEQADAGSSPITPRTDLYALGLIAFRLLVGRDYWHDGPLVKMIAQIAFEPMVPPSTRGSTLGVDFDAWFLRACNRDTEQRFASAGEEVEALAKALGLPVAPVPTPSGSGRISGSSHSTLETAATLQASSSAISAPRTLPRSRRGVAIVAIVGAISVIGVVAFVATRGEAPPSVGASGSTVALPQASASSTASTTAVGAAAAPPVTSPSTSSAPSATTSASSTPSATTAKPGNGVRPPAASTARLPPTKPTRVSLGEQN